MSLILTVYNIFEQTNILRTLRGQNRLGAFHNMVLGGEPGSKSEEFIVWWRELHKQELSYLCSS